MMARLLNNKTNNAHGVKNKNTKTKHVHIASSCGQIAKTIENQKIEKNYAYSEHAFLWL